MSRRDWDKVIKKSFFIFNSCYKEGWVGISVFMAAGFLCVFGTCWDAAVCESSVCKFGSEYISLYALTPVADSAEGRFSEGL